MTFWMAAHRANWTLLRHTFAQVFASAVYYFDFVTKTEQTNTTLSAW
jgi:hypothetical protein